MLESDEPERAHIPRGGRVLRRPAQPRRNNSVAGLSSLMPEFTPARFCLEAVAESDSQRGSGNAETSTSPPR